jgi:dUTP pyrophosphatase
LPEYEELAFDDEGFLDLAPGVYQVVFAEVVDLPTDLMALGRPRSSLCRSGVTLHTSVWDAGYRGRSTSLLQVINPAGFRVQQGARLLQLVFFGMDAKTAKGYSGVYQNENTGSR